MSDDGEELDLSPHRLAPARAAEPGGLTVIAGYVGAGRDDDYVRIYVNLAMSAYIEVAVADVVRTRPVDRDDPDSPRQIWIKTDANVRVVRVEELAGPASFVQGAMRRKYAARETVQENTDFPCTIFWICDPSPIAITEATGGTWPCSGTDVWPQCPDCC
jgi:hypothetical protein